MKPIYLDYSATTPVRREVLDAMLPLYEEQFGNASSIHRWGREARAVLEQARARLAAVLGAAPSEIVFTRGGTEADNLAILGRARHLRGAPVVCSAIEHKAVLASAEAARAEGNPLHLLPVSSGGIVDADALQPLLAASPSVVSVMWVNNEVGTVQPVQRLAEECAAAGVAFHTDAIQAFGKLSVRVDGIPAALVSVSAHKIGGPKGTGALFIRRGTKVEPLIHGGSHERGMRAGTEDVAGAVGLAVAAELASQEREVEMARLGALRDRLEAALREQVPELVVNGAGEARVPIILNVSVPGVNADALIPTLDLEGFAVSSGSACSSGAVTPSHVLTAMGVSDELAGPSVRFSLGHQTTSAEIERVIAVFPSLMARLRSFAEVG
jgi:cysteine desulfurase